MEPGVVLFVAFLIAVPLLARTRTYWKLYNLGTAVATAKLSVVIPRRFVADTSGAANILYLVVTLIAAGLALKLGIGMMAEADNTITPPDQNNTEAYEAYQKTTNTIWKSFQMSPMALYATVFGVVIGAVVSAFGVFSRGGGGV